MSMSVQPSIDTLFCSAIEIDAPDKREAFLQQACGDDAELRRQVDRLLVAHFHGRSILDAPAHRVAGTIDEPLPERSGTIIGPYKLLEQIGEGGFGVVFMAEQTQPVRRKVAVKVIRPGMDTRQVIARFEAERQALALMDHPHIARVFDAGTTESGRPYFVMELVKGMAITAYCDHNQLSTRERLELFVPVCQAVQHAHQKGIIHRDIKPSNVLVTEHDGTPVVKVIDFGIAKATGQQLTDKTLFTNFAQMIGTPLYLSPEQAALSGLDVDTRSDIYSLGVLLYELLTGVTPFDRERFKRAEYDEIRRIIREEEPPKPSTRVSTAGQAGTTTSAQRRSDPKRLSQLFRGELDWIVMKALEKDRSRRYETANGFSQDVQRYLNDEPVQACPPSVGYRIRKFARRNKGVFASASAILVALLLGTMVSTWHAIRAELARSGEAEQRQKAEQAQAQAEATSRALEVTLTDLHTSHGVMAGERGEPALASLWFANAVRMARHDPDREQANRIRVRTWNREALTPVRALAHPRELLTQMAFHPEGRHLLTLSKQNKCMVWDLDQEQPLPWASGNQAVHCAVWSPDGHWLAWGTSAGEVEIYRFPEGKLLHRLEHRGAVQSLAFSFDGRFLALASDVVGIWDCQTKTFADAEFVHPRPVLALAFNSSGDRLLTACLDGQARVFELTGKQGQGAPAFPAVPHRFKPDWGVNVICPLWIDKDRSLLTLGQSGQVECRDSQTGKLLRTIPSFRVGSLATSPDGGLFAWGGLGRATIHEPATGQRVGPDLQAQHDVLSMAFSPDGLTLLTGSVDRTVRLWAVPDGKPLFYPLVHPTMVTLVAYSPNGEFIATGQENGLVRVWRLPHRNPLDRLIHLGGVSSWEARFFGRLSIRDGYVAVSGYPTARVYELASGKAAGPVLTPGGEIVRLVLAADGHTAAMLTAATLAGTLTGTLRGSVGGGSLQFWDWRTGRRLFDPLPLPSQPHDLAYSPDGKLVLAICKDGEVFIVDAAEGQIKKRVKHTRDQKVGTAGESFSAATHGDFYQAQVRFVDDGRGFVTAGLDSNMRVWDTATGELRYAAMRHQELCNIAAISPDGRLLLSDSRDHFAKVWDVATGQSVGQPLPHPDWLAGGCFSPDGHQVLTGCRDGMARLWDWRTGQLACAPFKRSWVVRGSFFAREGRWVLASDGRFWDRKTAQPITPSSPAGEERGVQGSCDDLQLTGDGRFAVAWISNAGIAVVDLGDLDGPDEWSAGDLCLHAELVCGHRIHESDVDMLTTDQWLERWRSFRERHPSQKSDLEARRPGPREDQFGWLTVLTQQAQKYQAEDRADMAESLYVKVLDIQRRVLGDEHAESLNSMTNLAATYMRRGQLDKAEPLLVKAVEANRRVSGGHANMLTSLNNLASLYDNRWQLDKAEPLFREALERTRERHGEASLPTAGPLASLARNLLRQKKYADAEQPLRECLTIHERELSDDWSTFERKTMLGGSLLGQKKYADAEPLLLAGYDGMSRRESRIPVAEKMRLTEAAERLVEFYDATGKKNEAAEWRKTLETRDGGGTIIGDVREVGKGLQLKGRLDDVTKAMIYQVHLLAGATYVVEMVSPEPQALDSFLRLKDSSGKRLAEDDDSAGNLNARIVFRAEVDAVYRIQATSYGYAGRGAFTLTVKQKYDTPKDRETPAIQKLQ
jgi:eukaryotic-like serine/threonine-protein kinase